MNDLPAWAGTIPGWITATSSTGLIAVVLWFLPQWMRARTERHKVDIDADTSLRADLLARIAKLERDGVDAHAACAARIAAMGAQIDGLRRQLIASQIAMAQALPLGKRTPEIEAMIERVMGHVDILVGEDSR